MPPSPSYGEQEPVGETAVEPAAEPAAEPAVVAAASAAAPVQDEEEFDVSKFEAR